MASILEELFFIRRILAISEAGLAYASDRFDIERYQDLRQLAVQRLSELGNVQVTTVAELFKDEAGYPTPKVDVRAFIRQKNQVLLVENSHGEWALPGGFAEIGWTLKENVIKEVHEETGLTVNTATLRAVYDTSLRKDVPQTFQYYKFIFACTVESGEFVKNSETVAMQWFDKDQLPPLSMKRTTPEQIAQLFDSVDLHVD